MKGKGSTWQSDLANAHILENQFAERIQQLYPKAKIKQAPTGSSFSDWDIEVIWPKGSITFEIKEDRQASEWSSNVAVEFGRTLKDGTYKPTCLSISKADCWVYYFHDTFWLIGAADLKELVKTANRTIGGDGNKAHIYLVKKDKFLSKAHNCFEYLAA